jgi:hypothetical protein
MNTQRNEAKRESLELVIRSYPLAARPYEPDRTRFIPPFSSFRPPRDVLTDMLILFTFHQTRDRTLDVFPDPTVCLSTF